MTDTTVIVASPATIVIGNVPPIGQKVLFNNRKTANAGTSIKQILASEQGILPIITSDRSSDAITWTAPYTTVQKIYNVLSISTYQYGNVVSEMVSVLLGKLASNDGLTPISFTRDETELFRRAYSWVSASGTIADINGTTASILSKTIDTTVQTIPDNDFLDNNLIISEDTATVSTALTLTGEDALGVDSTFSVNFAPLLNTIEPINVSESVVEAVKSTPALIGVSGGNCAPITFDNEDILNGGELTSTADTTATDAYNRLQEEELQDLFSEQTLLTPIIEQPDIVAALCTTTYAESVMIGTVPVTVDGTATDTLVKLIAVEEVTIDSVLSTIGNKSLLELDWSATEEETSTDDSRSLPIVTRRTIDIMKYHPSQTSAKLKSGSTLKYYSIINPGREIKIELLSGLSSVLRRIVNAVTKAKLSDIENITNTVSIGLAALAPVVGSAGLTSASNALATISNGFGTLQQLAAKIQPNLTNATTREVFNTLVTSSPMKLLPAALKVGENILKESSKSKKNLVPILSKMDADTKKIIKLASEKSTASTSSVFRKLRVAKMTRK